jgi:thiol-disulfide isomerase/thioredoxin
MNLFDHWSAGLPYEAFVTKYGSDADKTRWQRVLDQSVLNPAQTALLAKFTRKMPVLCLAGAWCGDCASQCPMFRRFAEVNPKIDLRFLDRDDHADVQKELQICGGNRVPVAVFFSEDGHEVSRFGERTLSQYRQLMQQAVGESCATGLTAPDDPLPARILQDWLNEFERVQCILRLSPRLRRKHGD